MTRKFSDLGSQIELVAEIFEFMRSSDVGMEKSGISGWD